MTITGTIKRMGEIAYKGPNRLEVLDTLIETEEQYSQTLKVQFVGKSAKPASELSIGAKVIVDVNLKGYEHNGKYYVSVEGWRITPVAGTGNYVAGSGAPKQQSPAIQPNTGFDDDSLPF